MSREFKFRAWDQETEKMMFPENGYFKRKSGTRFQISADGKVNPVYIESESIIRMPILMEFIGITTKNIDVYEGDIFREEIEHDEGDIRTYSAVVWIRQRGAFYLVPVAHLPILRDNDVSEEKEFSWLFDDANLYDLSLDVGLPLVGNIYQNSNLLKS